MRKYLARSVHILLGLTCLGILGYILYSSEEMRYVSVAAVSFVGLAFTWQWANDNADW